MGRKVYPTEKRKIMTTEEIEAMKSTATTETTETVTADTQENSEDTLSQEELLQKYKEERAAKSRILEEKRKAKSQIEEMTARLAVLEGEKKQKELSALSVEDRLTVLQKESDQRENEWRAKLEEKENELQSFSRKIKVKEYTSDIKFKSDVPGDITDHILTKTFDSVDINDMTQVHAAKKSIAEKYPSFVLVDAPKGAGGPTKQNSSKAVNTSISEDQYMSMSRSDRLRLPSEVRAKFMTSTKSY